MAQVRSTRYLCDACGVEQERRRDLVRFFVRGKDYRASVEFDLCNDCEAKFVTSLSALVPEGQNVEALRRSA